MNKRDYILKALAAGAYKGKSWVISVFSVSKTVSTDEPYSLTRNEDGLSFKDLETGEMVHIDGSHPDKALFEFKERLTVEIGEVPNVKKKTETTYGNLFINYLVLVHPFGSKIDFMIGVVSAKEIEKIIESKFKSNPPKKAGDEEEFDPASDPNNIYVSEYLAYTDAMCSIAGYTQLCVPSASPKTITPPPGIKKLRDQLLAENADRLNDPVVVAEIEGKLLAHDREYYGDDEDAMGFFMKSKSTNVARKRMFLMHGLEAGFDEANPQLVVNSLEEGWDTSKLPAMNNSLREGVYSRGALTALGGEAVKYFYRIMQNSRIAEPDCGTKRGLSREVTKEHIGFSIVDGQKVVKLDKETIGKYKGKVYSMRSPLYCKTVGVNFCETCMGDDNSNNPNGLGAAAADVGSTFLGLFMAKMHGTELSTQEVDLEESIT